MMNFSKTTTWLIIVLIIVFCTAGFFAYQWWQVKGELAKEIEENENLAKQVGELQAEINKLQKEIEELKVSEGKITEEGKKVTDETAEWKTYRNEEYGFEISYPTVEWELNGTLCKVWNEKKHKAKENFCIYRTIEFLYPDCYDYSWEEIFASGEYTKPYPGGKDCILGRNKGGEFEKEITTNFGVKGYKGKMNFPLYIDEEKGISCEKQTVVYFPLKKEVELKRRFLSLFSLSYFDCPDYFAFGPEEIDIFDKIAASFRFIEE